MSDLIQTLEGALKLARLEMAATDELQARLDDAQDWNDSMHTDLLHLERVVHSYRGSPESMARTFADWWGTHHMCDRQDFITEVLRLVPDLKEDICPPV